MTAPELLFSISMTEIPTFTILTLTTTATSNHHRYLNTWKLTQTGCSSLEREVWNSDQFCFRKEALKSSLLWHIIVGDSERSTARNSGETTLKRHRPSFYQ